MFFRGGVTNDGRDDAGMVKLARMKLKDRWLEKWTLFLFDGNGTGTMELVDNVFRCDGNGTARNKHKMLQS